MLEPRLSVVGFEPPEVVVGPLGAAADKQPVVVVVVAHKLVEQVALVVLAVEPQQFVVAQLVLPQLVLPQQVLSQRELLQPPGLFLELPLKKLTIT